MASVYKRGSNKRIKGTCWTVAWTDETGKRRTRKGFTDRVLSEQLAHKLEQEAKQVRSGLIAHSESTLIEKPLLEHLTVFAKHLKNRDVSEKRINEVLSKLKRILETCQISKSSQITGERVENCLGGFREKGMGKQTSNHYLRAMKQFCTWMVKTGRCRLNRVQDVPMLNVKTDRRHDRRALGDDEFHRLVTAAESGIPIENISGPDRAMMYILSAWTGYRKGEIGSLTFRSFDLESEPQIVTVQAIYSKRKRQDTQVLHPDVSARFKDWIATKKNLKGDTLLFPVSEKVPGGKERKTAKMMKKDLEFARHCWIKEAKNEEERQKREESDFLSYINHEGLYADFHANRHTFITNLSRGGVSPKTAQTLARHSDIRLTLGIYTHTDLAEKTEAVHKLPKLPAVKTEGDNESNNSTPETTANETLQRYSSASDAQPGNSGHLPSTTGTTQKKMVNPNEFTKVIDTSVVSTTSQSDSQPVSNTPGGARTPNPRFRRPMLYPIELRVLNPEFFVDSKKIFV